MTTGMVVVGRRFESLAGTVAGLPARVALVMVSGDRALGSTLPGAPLLDSATAVAARRRTLVMVSGDRALGSTLPDAPLLDWATAMRSGLVTIEGEPWFARPLGETGDRIWALVSARDQRGESRQLWLGWVVSLLATAGAAGGVPGAAHP